MERTPVLSYSFFQHSYPELDESNAPRPATASTSSDDNERQNRHRTTPHHKVYSNLGIGQENGKKLYMNARTSDVTFSFDSNDGSVARIVAHKNLLAAQSDVFEALFYGKSKSDRSVHMRDVSDGAFKEFLQYFYLSEVKLSIENIGDVMHLGHKYNVTQCVSDCVGFLTDVLTDENVCTIFLLAIRYDQSVLIKHCERRVMVNTAGIFKTIGFLMCDWEVLGYILKMDVLTCSEVEVFEACMAWVRAQSKQITPSRKVVRKFLGDLYYAIRFASMSIAEFCALECKFTGVLASDFKKIIHMIAGQQEKPLKFNLNPRFAKWNPNGIIECDRKSQNGTLGRFALLATETVTFSTSQVLLLGGFACGRIMVNGRNASDRNLRANFPVKVKITEQLMMTDDKATAKMISNFNAELQSMEIDVLLPRPVVIRPEFIYTICIGTFPDEHVSYAHELKHKVHVDADIDVQFHNCFAENGKIFELISMVKFNRI